jgi:hypothetical protein
VNDIDPEYGCVNCELNSGCLHIGVDVSCTSERGDEGPTASTMFMSRRTPASDGRALSVLVDLLLLLWHDGSMSGVS